MAHRTAVILVVGLCEDVLGAHTPRMSAFRAAHETRRLAPPLPAVTLTSQASMLTGRPVAEHGVVANGWFDRDTGEARFWRQSLGLVGAEPFDVTAKKRDPSVTVAKMFWWFNMQADTPAAPAPDLCVTPRPMYPADGRKIPDIWTRPASLRDELQAGPPAGLGRFPLFRFWGPASSIESSAWIADATARVVERRDPTLTMAYLPHLDYALQREGPGSPEAARSAEEVDRLVGGLLDLFEARGTRVLLCSEYGIEPVAGPAETGPGGAVFINRALREAGLLAVREELGREQLDPFASRAFAVCDHQCAHVYAADPASLRAARDAIGATAGVGALLDRDAMAPRGLAHARSGDLLAVADAGRWFAYDFWLDERRAPDYARTVDIHRKPGYDPRELQLDPRLGPAWWAIGRRLARKKLGFRGLMDVIPLDPSGVRGSHGRADTLPAYRPLLIGPGGAVSAACGPGEDAPMERVRDAVLAALFD